MRSLDLNLSSRPFRNNTPLWIGFGVLAAAVVAFTAWNAATFLDQRAHLAALDAELGGADAAFEDFTRREAEATRAIRTLDAKNLAVQTARANQFLMRRGLSWTRLFNLLEKVQPPEIKMTAVRPVFSRETRAENASAGLPPDVVPLSVEGIAQDLDAFLEFERQVLQDPHFARVEPQRADRMRNSKEVQFDLRFLYDPDGRLGAHSDAPLPPVLAAQAEAEESAPAGDGVEDHP